MIIDSLENIEFYRSVNNDFYQGLLFIKNSSPDIELGEYPLTATAKALVMEYETNYQNTFGYEAHRNLIDIQYCIKGTERIPWSHLSRLTPYTEYDLVKDVTFYKWTEKQGEVIIGDGVFSIFYPTDAHAPVFCTDEPTLIRKIVIKVSI
ncbi:YhcH/YjgK/YiaL family protein [Mucilaginibacter mali]|uniref:YhcH/YjgK/YiaL family protein n=1 Tax=Mucilaginibacter mali TaxID=2740462 RepID=A0A7D4TP03_9SPHI|nr:YhcH/YjgK/YiaL family protein [Mucilaginibacter mali]QKJ31473.1 YhcH/YjgK/YiaL family protein [Mucilaginibacter mali]